MDPVKTVLFRATTKTKVCLDSIVTDGKLTMEIKSISWNTTNIWLFWNRILPGSLIAFHFTSVLAYPARVSLDLPRRIEGDSARTKRQVAYKPVRKTISNVFSKVPLLDSLNYHQLPEKFLTFLKLEGCSPRFFKLLLSLLSWYAIPKNDVTIIVLRLW